MKSPSSGAAASFEDAVGRLNADYFFREFTFSSNKFTPEVSSELELADKIISMGDLLIVSQIKERNAPAAATEESEIKWFRDAVRNKATSQIRDTLKYLADYSPINLVNDRGDTFSFAESSSKQVHKLVIYNPHVLLPAEYSSQKHHLSKTVGTIHFLHSGAYLDILRTLVTPVEISDYFAFRERMAVKWKELLSPVSERAILGQFIRNLPDEPPDASFTVFFDQVNEKEADWDIARIIHLFPERRNTPQSLPKTSYQILTELASLYRTEMAAFKVRFAFSMRKAIEDERSLPNRFSTSRGCGFVFIPLLREDVPNRHALLINFTALNKYDQKLDRCIGISFTAEEGKGGCDVQWCPMEFPWKEDPTLQASLNKAYPFAPVRERAIERYGLLD